MERQRERVIGRITGRKKEERKRVLKGTMEVQQKRYGATTRVTETGKDGYEDWSHIDRQAISQTDKQIFSERPTDRHIPRQQKAPKRVEDKIISSLSALLRGSNCKRRIVQYLLSLLPIEVPTASPHFRFST